MQQVIDIKKTKTNQEIQDISDHNLRQKISNNIDKKRIKNNIYFVGSPGQKTIDILEEKLSKVGKYRKDAVKVVNLVLSASPDFFKDKSKAKEWEEITQKYIEETFGKENILYSVVHKDEKTPCGWAKNIGREGEEWGVLTLAQLRDFQADMFTTVFVGNAMTQNLGGKMVTPRGYLLEK